MVVQLLNHCFIAAEAKVIKKEKMRIGVQLSVDRPLTHCFGQSFCFFNPSLSVFWRSVVEYLQTLSNTVTEVALHNK